MSQTQSSSNNANNSTNGSRGNNPGKGTGMGSSIGDGKNQEYEKIFTPKTIGGEGEISNINGQKNGSNSSDIIRTDKSAAVEGDYLPYDQVIGEYKEKALENFNSYTMPEGMKEIIKQYFTSLEE